MQLSHSLVHPTQNNMDSKTMIMHVLARKKLSPGYLRYVDALHVHHRRSRLGGAGFGKTHYSTCLYNLVSYTLEQAYTKRAHLTENALDIQALLRSTILITKIHRVKSGSPSLICDDRANQGHSPPGFGELLPRHD